MKADSGEKKVGEKNIKDSSCQTQQLNLRFTHQFRVFALSAASVKSLRGVLKGPRLDNDVPLGDVTRATEFQVVKNLTGVVGRARGLVKT